MWERHSRHRVQHVQRLAGVKGCRVWEGEEKGTTNSGTLVGVDCAGHYGSH